MTDMLSTPEELLAKPCDHWCELEIMSAYYAIKALVAERDRWKENFVKVQERERIEWARAEKAEADLAAARLALATLYGCFGPKDMWLEAWPEHAPAIAAARAEGGE